jgi:ABC-type dipeptide/oligopeptide/nickel transport system permease subunit
MNAVDAIQTVANATQNVTNLVNKGFRLKLFLIVGFCTFVLGLGVGLTAGVYYGYRKWTKKVDTLMEQSKEYRKTIMEKVKEKL